MLILRIYNSFFFNFMLKLSFIFIIIILSRNNYTNVKNLHVFLLELLTVQFFSRKNETIINNNLDNFTLMVVLTAEKSLIQIKNILSIIFSNF